MESIDREFIDANVKYILRTNAFNEEAYARYNVKRGLRNLDGSGVLVGLTEIGDVHGYIVDENEIVPVDGRLQYRGIPVNDLVEGCRSEGRFGFEETAYLLLFGKLPTGEELSGFTEMLGRKRVLPETFTEDMVLKAPSNNIMNKLARSVLAYYSYDPDAEKRDVRSLFLQCIDLLALFPTMVAYGFQAKRHYYDEESLFIHAPRPELSTAENFLHLIRDDSVYTPLEAELLDLCLILHAEHGGGNNSAFAVHVVSSADTDTYSAIAAGIGSLKGDRHGGANIKVMNMMHDLKSHVSVWDDEAAVADYLSRILKKDAFDRTGLIYGVGHAVYTLSDPRAVLLRARAKELAREKGKEEEFKLYTLVERLAPEMFAKVKGSKKTVSANVDFYSGFVYSLLDIPEELYTPLFAISRVAGWSAHRVEEVVHGGRIIRPAFKSVSQAGSYIPLAERG